MKPGINMLQDALDGAQLRSDLAAELAEANAQIAQALTATRLCAHTELSPLVGTDRESRVSVCEHVIEELRAVSHAENSTPVLFTPKLLQLYNAYANRTAELDALCRIGETALTVEAGHINYRCVGITLTIDSLPWDVARMGLIQICKVLQQRAVRELNKELLTELEKKLPPPQ